MKSWYPSFFVKRDGDWDNYALFRCPWCGDLGNIDKDQYEGKVSIQCDCGFHVTLDLRHPYYVECERIGEV